ncbi:hypothetical protein ZIOFF_063897 [Zingiber officinale]|uniref:Uncharacterized protein n=1 Tax=Zingiber officinale TaxID=94328 RepID=A0A8J5F245_ZINOF|nr:hypothetical protein ZIOFF_063897 [Zingiber officinale]
MAITEQRRPRAGGGDDGKQAVIVKQRRLRPTIAWTETMRRLCRRSVKDSVRRRLAWKKTSIRKKGQEGEVHPHSTDPRNYLNFDDYANNAILSDDANAQMMRSDKLLESEQYALAMVAKYDNNNNNNENRLENEVEGVVAKPLTREVSKAIGNPPSNGYNGGNTDR